jgi:hypothetical protein
MCSVSAVEPLIAHNPDPDSRLPYLMRVPPRAGMVFHTSGTWPRTAALHCYPKPADQWPTDPQVVERVPARSCVRRGAAVDLVLDRARESRSRIVFTSARGPWHARGELASIPRAAVMVEDRHPQVFTLDRVPPAQVADGLAELHVRRPSIPIVFCETRPLAEEWTYRYLTAAYLWATAEAAIAGRVPDTTTELADVAAAPERSTAEVRAWAKTSGLAVPDRGRLRPDVWAACHATHHS